MNLPQRDSAYFRAVQTGTPWGRTLQKFADWIAPREGCRTLDVGCGPGIFPAILEARGCRAFGVDLDARHFHPPRLHPRLGVADASHLPFPESCFDLVTASNVLFLLPHPLQALAEWRRVLRPGGRLALLNPSPALSVETATRFADQRGLDGLARQSLLRWAARAEAHPRWQVADYARMFRTIGVQLRHHTQKVGPGFASWVLACRPSQRPAYAD